MDTIALSDDDSNASDVIDLDESNDDVIEVCEIRDDWHNKNDAQYDHIVKESKILGELIEKCLDLENTKGMIRVINRSLIPTYYSTTEHFRTSDVFTTVVSRSIRKLDSDPDHKFSHIKDLCIEMKKQSRKLEEKAIRQRKSLLRQKNAQRRAKNREIERKKIKVNRKKRKLNGMEHIVLSDDDDSDSFEVPVIDLEEHASKASINDVPCINEDRVKEIELIEIEIDSVNIEIKSSHPDKITSRTDSSILTIGSDNQSQNSECLPNTMKHKPIDTRFKSSEAQLSSKTHEMCNRTDNSVESLPQDNNAHLLRLSNPKGCDNEVSSTEISSTVPEDDYVRGSQDSDLIVLDEVNNDLHTIAQEFSKESHSVQSNRNIPVLIDDKCKESTEKMHKDLIVLHEENETVTTTQDINQDLIKEVPKVDTDSAQNSELIKDNDLIVIDDEDDLDSNAHNNNSINVSKSLLVNDENNLLVPHKAEVFEGPTEDQLMMRIKKIEVDIAECKAKVTDLEQQEVDNDSVWSPYIQCEKYKAKIVNLYKELCKLTGERSVKRREVRLTLKADNQRSQMCVDKLENFINSNIGPDGFPHFPDFQDVLECVRRANKEGDLGWNRGEVMREANALFTYCGRALQESRKRREWRDMLSLVKTEAIEDPADNDPELMARLQANKQTAVKRENDLLERYTEMTYLQPNTECTKENDTYESDSENDTENEEIDVKSTPETVRNTTSQFGQNNNVNECTNKFTSLEVLAQKLVDAVYNKPNVNSVQKQDVQSQIVRKRCTLIKLDDRCYRHAMNSNKKPEIPPDIDHTNILNHNFELIPKVVVHRLDLSSVPTVKYDITAAQKDNISADFGIEIKKEPLDDIQEKLNNLGTDFTASVIDIEDPFLVVEISSDSEDEDNGFTGNADRFL